VTVPSELSNLRQLQYQDIGYRASFGVSKVELAALCITLLQIDQHSSELEKFDVQGILAFAERVLPRASDLWMQASLDQRQRLQQLFFPDGVAFDGNRFVRTGVSTHAFNGNPLRRVGCVRHRRLPMSCESAGETAGPDHTGADAQILAIRTWWRTKSTRRTGSCSSANGPHPSTSSATRAYRQAI